MNEIADKLNAGIDRFLTEMGPYWKKDPLRRLFGDLDSDEFKSAISELEDRGVIQFVGHEDCYFIVSGEYLKKNLPPEFLSSGLNQVFELKEKYCK